MFVICDVESTGLIVEKDRIVSLSASYTLGNNRVEFNELVNPGVNIPADATRIHGITNNDVKDKDNFAAVGERFFRWVYTHAGYEPILCAYNGLGYDFRIIFNELKRHQVKMPPFGALYSYDPLRQARNILADLPSKRQAAVFEHLFGCAPTAQHTSMGDVIALERIVEHVKFASTSVSYIKPLPLLTPRVPFAEQGGARSCPR